MIRQTRGILRPRRGCELRTTRALGLHQDVDLAPGVDAQDLLPRALVLPQELEGDPADHGGSGLGALDQGPDPREGLEPSRQLEDVPDLARFDAAAPGREREEPAVGLGHAAPGDLGEGGEKALLGAPREESELAIATLEVAVGEGRGEGQGRRRAGHGETVR